MFDDTDSEIKVFEIEYLRSEIVKLFPEVSDIQISQLYHYYEMIINKNKVMNLTAITEFKEFVIKHFVDSLMLYTVYSIDKDIDVIDIGTGAGFPGIPLKIMFPQIRVTLFDSLQKRLVFLDEVISELHLSDIHTVHGRAEEYGRKPEYREQYDLVVSRAVAEMTSLSEICLPFVKVGGSFVAYKGNKGNEELLSAKTCIKLLGGKVLKTSSFSLTDNDGSSDRVLINVIKTSSTESKYPRGGGKPFKQPLLNK